MKVSKQCYGDLQYSIAGDYDKIWTRCLEGISENSRYNGNHIYDLIRCLNLHGHPLDFKV